MDKKKTKPTISKEDFIEFLMQASPEDLNKLILEKGKPRKTYSPIYLFKNKKSSI